MRAVTVLSALAVVAAVMFVVGTAAAKGPFRAEISGGDLPEPVSIEGPLTDEIVFLNDHLEAAPPENPEPSYTVRLIGIDYPVVESITYYPGDGSGPALLRGHWGTGDRYFEASAEFQATLDGAIGSVSGGGVSGGEMVWYIAPGLAAVGFVLLAGLAGRRLLLRA